MNLTYDSIGTYVLRRKRFTPALNKYVGKILRVDDIGGQAVYVTPIEQWDKVGPSVQLPGDFAVDGGWYDITDLMFQANDAVLPEIDEVAFLNDVSMSYRVGLGDLGDMEVEEGDAIGRLVFRGKCDSVGMVKLHSVAYFIVDVDDEGYIMSYYGFGRPVRKGRYGQQVELRLLRLRGSDVRLYDAERVIEACNEQYMMDKGRASRYMESARTFVSAGSVGDVLEDAGVGIDVGARGSNSLHPVGNGKGTDSVEAMKLR